MEDRTVYNEMNDIFRNINILQGAIKHNAVTSDIYQNKIVQYLKDLDVLAKYQYNILKVKESNYNIHGNNGNSDGGFVGYCNGSAPIRNNNIVKSYNNDGYFHIGGGSVPIGKCNGDNNVFAVNNDNNAPIRYTNDDTFNPSRLYLPKVNTVAPEHKERVTGENNNKEFRINISHVGTANAERDTNSITIDFQNSLLSELPQIFVSCVFCKDKKESIIKMIDIFLKVMSVDDELRNNLIKGFNCIDVEIYNYYYTVLTDVSSKISNGNCVGDTQSILNLVNMFKDLMAHSENTDVYERAGKRINSILRLLLKDKIMSEVEPDVVPNEPCSKPDILPPFDSKTHDNPSECNNNDKPTECKNNTKSNVDNNNLPNENIMNILNLVGSTSSLLQGNKSVDPSTVMNSISSVLKSVMGPNAKAYVRTNVPKSSTSSSASTTGVKKTPGKAKERVIVPFEEDKPTNDVNPNDKLNDKPDDKHPNDREPYDGEEEFIDKLIDEMNTGHTDENFQELLSKHSNSGNVDEDSLKNIINDYNKARTNIRPSFGTVPIFPSDRYTSIVEEYRTPASLSNNTFNKETPTIGVYMHPSEIPVVSGNQYTFGSRESTIHDETDEECFTNNSSGNDGNSSSTSSSTSSEGNWTDVDDKNM